MRLLPSSIEDLTILNQNIRTVESLIHKFKIDTTVPVTTDFTGLVDITLEMTEDDLDQSDSDEDYCTDDDL